MNTRASTQSQVPRLRISLPLIIAGMLLTGTMAQAVDISAPDVVFQKNQTVLPGDGSTDLAISIDGVLATDAVTSVDLVVTYDSAVAAPVLPIITTGTVINGWFTAANIVNNPGTIDEIRISAASSTALGDISTPADLVIIQFTTEDTDGILSTAVTFTTAELNEALVSVNATNGSIALGGSDGTVDLTPSDQIAGNPFDLVLTDLDLDGFTPLPSVVVERYDPADPPPPAGTGVPIETVTIDLTLATESPAGTFTYSLATVFDDGSAPNSGDLILGIQAGDLIDVLYVDTYDAQGGTSDVRLNPGDPITILAGVDGVVSLAPLSLPVGDSFTVNVTDADIPAGGGRGGGHRRALRSVLSSSDRTTY